LARLLAAASPWTRRAGENDRQAPVDESWPTPWEADPSHSALVDCAALQNPTPKLRRER
jgi:hypothetical protein